MLYLKELKLIFDKIRSQLLQNNIFAITMRWKLRASFWFSSHRRYLLTIGLISAKIEIAQLIFIVIVDIIMWLIATKFSLSDFIFNLFFPQLIWCCIHWMTFNFIHHDEFKCEIERKINKIKNTKTCSHLLRGLSIWKESDLYKKTSSHWDVTMLSKVLFRISRLLNQEIILNIFKDELMDGWMNIRFN